MRRFSQSGDILASCALEIAEALWVESQHESFESLGCVRETGFSGKG